MKIHADTRVRVETIPKIDNGVLWRTFVLKPFVLFFFSHQSTVYRNEKVIIKGNNLVIIKI